MGTAAAPRRFCRCACFCSENLYVARYGLHVRFRSEQQLRQDYEPVSGLYWLCGKTSWERWWRRDLSPRGRLLCLWPTQIGRED